MEVMVQNSSAMDNFEFSGTMSSPYLSAPSSPKRFGEYYLSAPTSPSRVSEIYGEFDDYYFSTSTIHEASTPSSSSAMHFEKVMAINNDNNDSDGDGFAFFVSRESEKPSRSAEELFDGGKIKLLEPKGNELFKKIDYKEEEEDEEEGGDIVFKSFSQKKKEAKDSHHQETQHRRGRDRTPASSSTLTSSNSGRRITRSHSPYRTPFQEQQQPPLTNKLEGPSILLSSNHNNNNKVGSSSKRWSIKDFLLFRSASEGRASTKDQLKNILFNQGINKTSSFRSIDSSSFRKKGHVSPHELHYAMKRAESEDLKKKTYLPYKQGILGRLAGFGL
ncbi:hypothetical protein PIB30_043738 [Stylosanthes scabra]|uniref:Uncharacterized protein n=1 Tax=Stylosanthes scabra TaxID=79078 RepID=A0ABU6WFP5_9FABA|nr:hypothetical protein [Stylosanthes scabra]